MKQWKEAAATALVTALLLALGWWLLSSAVTGLQSGAVDDLSRRPGLVLRTAHPIYFWFAGLFWLLLGIATVLLSLVMLLVLWEKIPAVQARKKAALDRATEAQVRRIEAGQGPEPPWVRFPGPTDSIPKAEMTAYMENDFLPFWLPLGADAQAAYLRRNPLPSHEWKGIMAGVLDSDVEPD